ncbi:MAG: CDP-diacylglycerol--serine O-phosphatidyltransferase [Elusimicrobia bacterium RIFOXYA2_FULL_39_19]|nr:MAG: CDP-diacylglycerol--serine O-phosphatidyltransferase [Elusimicrobia bacterium RIFOXYA2_FULL_39_19]
MGFGLYSIICSAKGNYTLAAWLILTAMFFDGFDGLIARATKNTSFLGVELDSFSDLTSFCIAPAVLMYFIVLKNMSLPGLAVGFLYVVFGALRLARYNVRSYEAKTLTPYFEGLPTPAAGGIIASIVLMFELLQRFEQGVTAKTIPIIMERIPVIFNFIPGIMILLSFLMITNLRYVGFSKMRTSKKISLNMFIILIVAVLLVIAYPENMIFIMFSIYVLSGIFEYVWRMNHIQREKVKIEKNG